MFLQDDIPLSFLLAGTELLRKVREAHGSRERLQRIIYTHSFAQGAPATVDLTGSPSGAPPRTPSTPADRPNESPPSSSRTLRYAMSTYTTPTTSPFKLHPSQASDSPEL